MEAIILSGGLGTRLRSLVDDVPKTMALVNGKPFLSYLLEYLVKFGCHRVVLSVGYKKELIQNYFHDNYKGMVLVYASEETPLGTGGALKNALKFVRSEKVLVMNGDSFFQVDLHAFRQEMQNEDIALCVKPMEHFERFGSVRIQDKKVLNFSEKTMTQVGYINTGIYWVSQTVFNKIDETVFSFETFLQYQKDIGAFVSDGYFIDIGVPEDYLRAQEEFKELF